MNYVTRASVVNINPSRLSEIYVLFNSFSEVIFSALPSHFIMWIFNNSICDIVKLHPMCPYLLHGKEPFLKS